MGRAMSMLKIIGLSEKKKSSGFLTNCHMNSIHPSENGSDVQAAARTLQVSSTSSRTRGRSRKITRTKVLQVLGAEGEGEIRQIDALLNGMTPSPLCLPPFCCTSSDDDDEECEEAHKTPLPLPPQCQVEDGKENTKTQTNSSFPCPEMYYLPSPRSLECKDVPATTNNTAHPLPTPTSTSMSGGKGEKLQNLVKKPQLQCGSIQRGSRLRSDFHDIPSNSVVSSPHHTYNSHKQTSKYRTLIRTLVPLALAPSTSRHWSSHLCESLSHTSTFMSPSPQPQQIPSPKMICPRKWTKGGVLGEGSFGTVYEGMNLEDGSFFAVKVSSGNDVSVEIQQEVAVLSKLEHPNIVRYLGSSIEEGRLCVFLELVQMGSLATILKKYKSFTDNQIRSYTKQILSGLEYLHKRKTIHRDIKCANILVDVNGQVKLSDFGVAKQVGDCLAASVKGTPLYMAPEVLMANKPCYSFPADIWSLGCTVLEMAEGKPPWSDLEGFAFYFKIKEGELPPMSDHLSSEGQDFVRSCLKFNPNDRPTANDLLMHPFITNASTQERCTPLLPLSPLAQLFPRSKTQPCKNVSSTQASYVNQVLVNAQRQQT